MKPKTHLFLLWITIIVMMVILWFVDEEQIPFICPNETITLDQELIDSLVSPDNYIQAFHTPVNFYYDNLEKQVTIYGIKECNRGQGMSMQPTMFDGNIVCMEEFKGTTVKVGDILKYKNDQGGYSIHRVRAVYDTKDGKRIYMQGDAFSSERIEFITVNDITAKIVAVLYR